MALGPVSIIAGGLAQCGPWWTRTHWVHETYAKIYYVMTGKATYQNECSQLTLVPGMVYFFPPHQASRHSCPGSMDVYWTHLQVDAPLLDLRLRHLRTVRSWSAEAWGPWAAVYRQLPQLLPSPQLADALRLQALVVDTCAMLLAGEPHAEDPELTQLRARFAPALQFMDEHCRRNPSLAEISRVIGLSPPHFHRSFRRAFQLTPHAYLLRRRMDIAQQLLAGTTQPVREVAQAAGYDDPFYFSRVFKRFFRVAPEPFRETRRSGG